METKTDGVDTTINNKTVTVSWPQHNKFFVDGFWNLLSEKYKVDVELVINNHVSKIHQIILALFCPSFKSYFHLLGESVIKLDNVTDRGEEIDLLVEFLYRGKVKVHEHELDTLLLAAENLGVQCLVDAIKRTKSKLEKIEKETDDEIIKIEDNEMEKKTPTPETEHVKSLNVPITFSTTNRFSKKKKKDASKVNRGTRDNVVDKHTHQNCDFEPLRHCPHCPFSHRCEILFNKHLTRHNANSIKRSFVCSVCNKVFRSRVGLRQHSLYHGDPNLLFNCSQCSFKTSQKSNWVRHLAVNHKIDPQGRTLMEDVKCELCPFVTTTQNLLKSHHIQKHSIDKPYKCNECDYSSLRKWDVVKHVRIVHRNERPFMCELCGYTSKTSGNLKNHVNRHLGLKPYKCKVCGQDFATISSLKMHSRIHAVGEKPFVCQLCGHGFLRRYRLTTHMKQVHQIDVVVDSKQRVNHTVMRKELVVEAHAESSTIECLLPADCDVASEASCIVMQLV